MMHAVPRSLRVDAACAATLKALVAVVAIAALALTAAAPPAHANPKYAGLVLDVNTGKTLYAENADAKRYPASLTKIMTVYIIFEELKAGRLRLSTKMRVSKYAAGRPPSKIGFKPGDRLAVRDAIKALVTKSANDVAVVVAEHISGSEAAFAQRMTKTAHRLGMKKTKFRNANGLPNPRQITTARDMAKLGIAVQRDFPQYYGVFQTTTFQFGKRRYRNHNKLLGRVRGVDGIKTGYIRASGFNLVTSVRRDGKHLVAVVMGGRTGARRNAHMKNLIGRYLPKAKKGRPTVVMAWNDRDAAPLPRSKPSSSVILAARLNARQAPVAAASDAAPAPADGADPIGETLLAFAADVRTNSGPAPAFSPSDTLRAVIAEATDAGIAAPNSGAGIAVPASSTDTVTLAAANGSPRSVAATAYAAAPARPVTREQPSQDSRFSAAFQSFERPATASRPARRLDRDALVAAIARAHSGTVTAPLSPENTAPQARTGPGEPERSASALAPAPLGWQIQIGAVGSRAEAEALLSDATQEIPGVERRRRVTQRVATDRGALYRARFAGFANQREARETCKRFANHNRPCWAVSM
ncbi:MAG: serine hydrolase [Pseudomonadota bacterium]